MLTDNNEINDSDAEQASYSYLISTVVLAFGLPIPILNMIATLMFYLNNRKRSYFVRFHCLQSLLSQVFVVAANSVGLTWTLNIVFGDVQISDLYIGYIITILMFNLLEFVASIYATIRTRKKHDVRFWFFGELTQLVCKP